MIHSHFYITKHHTKWKPGVSDQIYNRFKGYNKGNFNFAPYHLWVAEEGYEEGIDFIEQKVYAELYDFLENPEFHNQPTEYVDPSFEHVDGEYIRKIVEEIIESNPRLKSTIRKVKQEYIDEAVSDPGFLESVRMYPEKYLEPV